jgi:lipopolysaccharide transport system ATP-binding protein
MSDVVIKVENLSKRYILGASDPNKTIRESIVNYFNTTLKKKENNREPLPGTAKSGELWALREVCFEVEQGDIVGVIGRNGAGKSTLLKILTRITEPTTGKITMRGRVGSLLEVGTGFHPELSGHENIYLYGAILGMNRYEVTRKFDEIIAFAELEKFVDTPVKRYSSGMYMRLAFAVAAHLESEILLVDEVLAVGDASFQKKCLGKMSDVTRNEGRTVLFVSHNMQAINNLCQKAILLNGGCVKQIGPATEITQSYLQESYRIQNQNEIKETLRSLPPDPAFRMLDISIKQNNHPIDVISNGIPLEIAIEYEVLEKAIGLRVYFDVCDPEETLLFRSFHDEQADGIPTVQPGHFISTATVPENIFGPITYTIKIHAGIHNIRNCTPADGICFNLPAVATGAFNKAYAGDPFRQKLGLVIPWKTDTIT